MNLFDALYEHNLSLWRLAREETRGLHTDSAEWDLLFHKGDSLAGWCTQMRANGSIREDEIPQVIAFPALDDTGPYAAWIAEIRTAKPRLYAYVSALEIIRLALLQEISEGQ